MSEAFFVDGTNSRIVRVDDIIAPVVEASNLAFSGLYERCCIHIKNICNDLTDIVDIQKTKKSHLAIYKFPKCSYQSINTEPINSYLSVIQDYSIILATSCDFELLKKTFNSSEKLVNSFTLVLNIGNHIVVRFCKSSEDVTSTIMRITGSPIYAKYSCDTPWGWSLGINLGIELSKKSNRDELCYCISLNNPGVSKFPFIPSDTRPLDSSNIILQETLYKNTNENGIRLLLATEAMSKVKGTIGPFSPVQEINDITHEDRFSIPVFQSLMSLSSQEELNVYGTQGGKGLAKEQAYMSAYGEAIERYCARMREFDVCIEGSFNHLREKHQLLDPNSLCLDPNYPYRYSDDKVIDWVEGVNLLNGSKILIPANIVFFLYEPEDETKQFLPQETTGLAAGQSITEAVLQGITEVIERDAYIIHARNMCFSSTLNLSSNSSILDLSDKLKIDGITLHLKYLKNDSPLHVIHCVTEDEKNNFPIFTHGVGASLNPYIAANRAITECFQLRPSQIAFKNMEKDSENAYIAWGNGDKSRLNNFLNNDSFQMIDDLENFSSGDMKKDIEIILEELMKNGYAAYAVNLSRRSTPLNVVRIIVPGYQPLDNTLRRKSSRMNELPKKLDIQSLGFMHKCLFD